MTKHTKPPHTHTHTHTHELVHRSEKESRLTNKLKLQVSGDHKLADNCQRQLHVASRVGSKLTHTGAPQPLLKCRHEPQPPEDAGGGHDHTDLPSRISRVMDRDTTSLDARSLATGA